MAKIRRKKQHFENGLISEMRDDAKSRDKSLAKKAIEESKKVKTAGKSVFASLSAKKASKLISFC